MKNNKKFLGSCLAFMLIGFMGDGFADGNCPLYTTADGAGQCVPYGNCPAGSVRGADNGCYPQTSFSKPAPSGHGAPKR